jgi:hypothetical protein
MSAGVRLIGSERTPGVDGDACDTSPRLRARGALVYKRGMRRHVGSALAFIVVAGAGLAACPRSVPPTPAPAPASPPDAAPPAPDAAPPPHPALAELTAIPDDQGTGEWRTAVGAVLRRHFDRDGSGELDSAAELASIPCAVWTALDQATLTSTQHRGYSFLVVYGFAPEASFVGAPLGLPLAQREPARVAAEACGLTFVYAAS